MDTQIITLSDHCRFHMGDEPEAWQAWYDDTDWQEVTLPHDWSVTLPFDRNCSSGTGYLPGGIGWYRLHIKPDESWRGRQISICFDGVYKNSRIWCNSYYLGERPNGYISFSYDITEQFRYDADNIISVYVDHREIADSRWYTGSGITRKVTLRIEESIHPVENGIFFSTPQVNSEQAVCEITQELVNCTGQDNQVTVTSLLFAPDDTLISEQIAQQEIAAHDTCVTKVQSTVPHPCCWTPETPSLYTLKTYLSYKEGEQSVHTLADTRKVGIRSLRFDADEGFFLNDVPYQFKGVCVHEDAGCFGNAVPAAVWHRRLAKLKAMGCNALRMSHNPHMPELYALCDALGFFVIDEAFDEWEGPKNKWSTGHNVYPPKHQGYYVNYPKWHEQDLTDMILRDRNHPSIVMWSIGNEIDYPNDPYCHPSFSTMTGNNDSNKPAAERMYNPSRPNAQRLAVLSRELCEIVHKTDATHPVTLAAAFPELSAKLGFIDPLDVVGFNYKEHLYEEHHKAFPDKPFLGSENGHSLSAWKAVTDNAYISGQFLWTGIDYLGEAHWPNRSANAGVLDTCGFAKDSFYFYQSIWRRDIPVAHLLPHWNMDVDQGTILQVLGYTNCDSAELILNGKSYGKKAYSYPDYGMTQTYGHFDKEPIPANTDNLFLGWDVPYEPGYVELVGFKDGKEVVRDRVETAGEPYAIRLNCYQDTLAADGLDVGQIEIAIVDEKGRLCPQSEQYVQLSVEGAGELIGIDNGNSASHESMKGSGIHVSAGQAFAVIQSTGRAGKCVVRVEAEGLQSAGIELSFI